MEKGKVEKIYPLTVSMTPSFLMEGDSLFKAQLRCLSEQEFKDFDVYVIDPHFEKRKSYMPELAAHYNLNIKHVPYIPNLQNARIIDCSIFNAAYCYSESPRIVRYSCWRFVRPNFTRICVESEVNCDFYFHSIEPSSINGYNPATGHNTDIWDFGSDEVHWDKMPKCGEKGATWTYHSEVDADATLFPKNAYGNYMVFRKDWLALNGCNESFVSTHFEDICFTLRARNLGLMCKRNALVMYRMHHQYGSHSQRSNIPVDYPTKKPCEQCVKASHITEPIRFDLDRRIEAGEVDVFDNIWVCKTCALSGAVYHADCGEYTTGIEISGQTHAPIIPKYKIGRNLNTLVADMDGKTLEEKIEIYTDSWTNSKYYVQ